MRSFLLVATLCLSSVFCNARIFYVSPTGNNSNPGTFDAPFLTLQKLNSVLTAGDIAYVRGGTYLSPSGNGADIHFLIENLTGTALNPIKIWAYPGETPILSCANITPTYNSPRVMGIFNCEYLHIKGFKLTMLKQKTTGGDVAGGCHISYSDNCTIELLEIFNIGGRGLYLDHSNNNLILNCDVHHMGDGHDTGYGAWNTGDGFSISGGDPSTDNIFDGCRAYLCCDDGWDFFDWCGMKVTLRNCQSFWNGVYPWKSSIDPDPNNMIPAEYASVDPATSQWLIGGCGGEGFKFGGHNPEVVTCADPNSLRKYVQNCVAFENTGCGFTANGDAEFNHKHQIVNCIAYRNGNDGFGYGTGRSTGIAHIFKNNISWQNNKCTSGADIVYDGITGSNISNNYWGSWYNGGSGHSNPGNLNSAFGGTVTLSAADFLSVSSAGAGGARQSDGSLPNLNFLKLLAGSDVINKGINVGLPYIGDAPDLGAYENGAAPVPVTLVEFTATAKADKTVLLRWKTSTEINSDYFVIERSADGVNFSQLAIVNANDNSSSIINYEFIDNTPGKSLNFYRLKMVDNDSRFKYSNIAVVTFKSTVNGNISILTNTADQQHFEINLTSGKRQQANYMIYDATGKMLCSSSITLQNGVNNISKNISLPGGVYYFRLETGDEKISLPMVSRN